MVQPFMDTVKKGFAETALRSVTSSTFMTRPDGYLRTKVDNYMINPKSGQDITMVTDDTGAD